MEKNNCLIILLCFIMVWYSAHAIPADWKRHIAEEMLMKYSEKGILLQNSFSSDGMSLFQGDISGIERDSTDSKLIMHNFINDTGKHWSNGIVPYELSPQYGNPDLYHEVQLITAAMDQMHISTNGCIKFVKRTNEADFLHIGRKDMACFSPIGKQGGKQTVMYNSECLQHIGGIQHELMHSLGFYHEMSRSDRDDYIGINWDNVNPQYKSDLDQKDGLTFGFPYDYNSVMHYPSNAFAIDPLTPTIYPKKGDKWYIGQNAGLSILDILKIQKAYKCPDTIYLFQVTERDGATKSATAKTEIRPQPVQTCASILTRTPVQMATETTTKTVTKTIREVAPKASVASVTETETQTVTQVLTRIQTVQNAAMTTETALLTTTIRRTITHTDTVTATVQLPAECPDVTIAPSDEDVVATAKINPTPVTRCRNQVILLNSQTLKRTTVYDGQTKWQSQTRYHTWKDILDNYDSLLSKTFDYPEFAGETADVQTLTNDVQMLVLHTAYLDTDLTGGGRLLRQKLETRIWKCE